MAVRSPPVASRLASVALDRCIGVPETSAGRRASRSGSACDEVIAGTDSPGVDAGGVTACEAAGEPAAIDAADEGGAPRDPVGPTAHGDEEAVAGPHPARTTT